HERLPAVRVRILRRAEALRPDELDRQDRLAMAPRQEDEPAVLRIDVAQRAPDGHERVGLRADVEIVLVPAEARRPGRTEEILALEPVDPAADETPDDRDDPRVAQRLLQEDRFLAVRVHQI